MSIGSSSDSPIGRNFSQGQNHELEVEVTQEKGVSVTLESKETGKLIYKAQFKGDDGKNVVRYITVKSKNINFNSDQFQEISNKLQNTFQQLEVKNYMDLSGKKIISSWEWQKIDVFDKKGNLENWMEKEGLAQSVQNVQKAFQASDIGHFIKTQKSESLKTSPSAQTSQASSLSATSQPASSKNERERIKLLEDNISEQQSKLLELDKEVEQYEKTLNKLKNLEKLKLENPNKKNKNLDKKIYKKTEELNKLSVTEDIYTENRDKYQETLNSLKDLRMEHPKTKELDTKIKNVQDELLKLDENDEKYQETLNKLIGLKLQHPETIKNPVKKGGGHDKNHKIATVKVNINKNITKNNLKLKIKKEKKFNLFLKEVTDEKKDKPEDIHYRINDHLKVFEGFKSKYYGIVEIDKDMKVGKDKYLVIENSTLDEDDNKYEILEDVKLAGLLPKKYTVVPNSFIPTYSGKASKISRETPCYKSKAKAVGQFIGVQSAHDNFQVQQGSGSVERRKYFSESTNHFKRAMEKFTDDQLSRLIDELNKLKNSFEKADCAIIGASVLILRNKADGKPKIKLIDPAQMVVDFCQKNRLIEAMEESDIPKITFDQERLELQKESNRIAIDSMISVLENVIIERPLKKEINGLVKNMNDLHTGIRDDKELQKTIGQMKQKIDHMESFVQEMSKRMPKEGIKFEKDRLEVAKAQLASAKKMLAKKETNRGVG